MKRKAEVYTYLILVLVGSFFISSCSSDDEPEEPIYHRSYVKGKLNSTSIYQNSVNAEILSDISNYDFKSNNQTDIPVELDWEACLINSKDTTVTLFLHIDDLFRTNGVIYSPNEKDVIKTKNTCYIAVTDKNKKTTRIYHPTHPFPISAMWQSFMVYDDGKSERLKNLTINYLGRRWPGISGELQGYLTNDDTSTPDVIKVDLSFILY